MPVVSAPYTEETGGTRKELASTDKFQPKASVAAEVVLDDFVLNTAGAKDDNICTIVLPSVELEAQALAQKLYKLNKGAHLTLTCKTLDDGAGDTDEKCFYESYGFEASSSGTHSKNECFALLFLHFPFLLIFTKPQRKNQLETMKSDKCLRKKL